MQNPDIESTLRGLSDTTTNPLPAQQEQQILRRINNRIGRGNHVNAPFTTHHRDEGEWQPRWPGVEMKHLRGDGNEAVCLFRMAPGAELPEHTHATDEESLILQGSAWVNGEFCEAGDYHFAPKGSTHQPLFSPDGALLWVRIAAA